MASIKTTFVTKSLADYNERSIAQMKAAAKRMGIGVTNEGLQSLAYQAYSQSEGGASSKLSLREYLRMVDMGAGRAHPLGGLQATAVTLQASNRSGLAQVKDKVRRPKKFYSKTVYGNLGILMNDLLYGYTEETIAQLKAEMNP